MTTAERIATAAHACQVDKAGRPYIDHPRRVASLVAEMTDDREGRNSTILHVGQDLHLNGGLTGSRSAAVQ
ncbi:hypothetical protein J4N02_00620 [Propioniciclava sp. MC1595]|uniref:hypothetical protein n=1 Tax=Propioniciclava sp. MC1595 TaxID=2760308 RepID=UPI001AA0B413|nr:hypothetical protein [Propioniciclava sp. MC1595]QTE26180.1 hypothetical protein J4N02_00620 [Propioniciclava sp. MC1595]